MRLLAAALALVLSGCLGPTQTPAIPGEIAAPSTDAMMEHHFDTLEMIPARPHAGQDFLARARVLPAGFEQRPACFVHNDGGRVGGAVREVEPGLYECRGAVGQSFGSVLWVGRERGQWVRSAFTVVRPDETYARRLPPSAIDRFDVEQRSERLHATVRVSPAPLANPLGTTRATAEVLRLPLNHAAYLGAAMRLAPTQVGLMEGEAPLVTAPRGGELALDAAERDPDFVLLSFATTTNDLGGFDISVLVEHGEGRCARLGACLRS